MTLLSSDDSRLQQHDAPWWQSAVAYQIYPRSFADSDGDGIGDLRGVISRLDHLEYLGVDVIWLSPIYCSPHDDNGYDISNYEDIDPTFGTLADVDELIATAHARGIRIVMDLVVNHTSDEHPWFIESASSTTNPKRDWYWWRPPREGFTAGQEGAEPTNWESFFSGSTWQLDEGTGEYYLHLFSRKQPDLNWENPEVRRAIHGMMNRWLDRGIDGFRMDVINLISKDPALPDGRVADGARWGDGFAHYAAGPRIHEFLNEMHDEVFAGRDRVLMTVGEMPGVTVEQAQLFTDSDRRELDMVFQFEHVGLDHGADGKWSLGRASLVDLKASFERWQLGLAGHGWNSLYWNNHDQPRAVSRFGNDGAYWRESATALATVLHMQQGTPFIYQGEEIGMTNVRFTSVSEYRDIETLNHFSDAVDVRGEDPALVLSRLRETSRDNARTPMQWTGEDGGGFTTGAPWIPMNRNHRVINVADQKGHATSVLEHYRLLIELRHRLSVIRTGEFVLHEREHESLFIFERVSRSGSLLVAANLSDVPETINVERSPWANYRDAEIVVDNQQSFGFRYLLPWQSVVLARDLDD